MGCALSDCLTSETLVWLEKSISPVRVSTLGAMPSRNGKKIFVDSRPFAVHCPADVRSTKHSIQISSLIQHPLSVIEKRSLVRTRPIGTLKSNNHQSKTFRLSIDLVLEARSVVSAAIKFPVKGFHENSTIGGKTIDRVIQISAFIDSVTPSFVPILGKNGL
jgi:hypothetical protein